MSIDCVGDTRRCSLPRRLAQRWRVAVGAAALGVAALGCSAAQAQYFTVPNTNANTAVSAAFAEFDLGSRFLKFLGDQGGVTWQGAPNAGGGGAPAAPAAPIYRAWVEGYGVRTHTGAQTDFNGDTRRTFGGVAGLGMTVAPGAMIGLSVDQSHSKIDVTDLPQHAKLDLTQIGINGVYEIGPWTVSGAGVYGFAKIDSTRDTFFGTATAAETGGFDPVTVPGQVAARARAFLGAEVGHTWIMEQSMFDLSAYGRVVDIYWRQVPSLLLSSSNMLFTPQTVQGVLESRIGFDTGAMASYRFARNARAYAGYDGRFRDGYRAHGGTLGVEVRW